MESVATKGGLPKMAVSEGRIGAVMRALDLILDEPAGIDESWEVHLRRLALAAIEAEDGPWD